MESLLEPITEELVQRIAKIIADNFDPVRIILFGSVARGDFGKNSDINILVVVDRQFSPENSRTDLATAMRRSIKAIVALDIAVYNMTEFEECRTSINHEVGRALREGRVLYERESTDS